MSARALADGQLWFSGGLPGLAALRAHNVRICPSGG